MSLVTSDRPVREQTPPTTRARESYLGRTAFVLPALVLLLTLTALPLFQVAQMSLYDYSDATAPVWAGLDNFTDVLGRSGFWAALLNTLVLTSSSVLLSVGLGLAIATTLNQPINTRVRSVFRSVFMIPWLFSSAVVGALWVMVLNPFGLLNHLLGLVGVDGASELAWLSDPDLAMLGIVVANVWRGLPFTMLMLLAALQTVDTQLTEAASLDGANSPQRFWYVTLPQLRPVLLTVVTLDTVWNFRSFDLVFIMTAGGPIGATDVLSTFVYDEAFRGLDFGTASAAALLMFLVMLAVSSGYLRASVKEESR